MTLTNLKIFREVLKEVKTAIGIIEGSSAFTDNILCIDISRPN
jgi:hypothetical protein